MIEHDLTLIIQSPILEGSDEVGDGFALDANVVGEDVVSDCEHAGDDGHVPAVEEGGEGASEFTDVDDDAGGLGGGEEAPAAGDAGVDCAEELLLRVGEEVAVGGEGDGHILEAPVVSR